MKHLRKFIKEKLGELLSESQLNLNLDDIIYGDNFHIFAGKIKSYHARIESGLIVRFYLREFLKYYDESDLDKISNWDEFVNSVHTVWNQKKSSKQEVVFRRGNISEESFFSNNIYVASVYDGKLNAYILNFQTPFIMDCKDADWMSIDKPKIMKDKFLDDKVSTDEIVHFIKKEKPEHDGIVLFNLYEGSGASAFGSSNIYISLNPSNITNLTAN